MNRRRFVFAGASAVAAGLPAVRVHAADPIRLLVGFAPGGTLDLIARAVAEGLRAHGYNCIVENKVGASGRLAIDALLSAPANGQTLMMAPSTQLTLLPFTTAGHSKALNTTVAVGSMAQCYFGLAVNAESGPHTLQEYLEAAKSTANRAFYATPGAGTVMDFLGQVLARKANVPLSAIPYKGGIAALNDLIGGVVPAAITATPNLLQMYRSRRIRLLGVTAETPLASMSEIPTFASLGYPEMNSSEYICIFARRDLPQEKIMIYSDLLRKVAAQRSTQDMLERQDYVPLFQSQAETNQRIDRDTRRWQEIVKSSGYVPI